MLILEKEKEKMKKFNLKLKIFEWKENKSNLEKKTIALRLTATEQRNKMVKSLMQTSTYNSADSIALFSIIQVLVYTIDTLNK